MIALIGDLHGDFAVIETLSEYVLEDTIFIQLGDFGFYHRVLENWPATKFPVYVIDGNHEDHEYIRNELLASVPLHQNVVEIKPNLFYVRRGSVVEIDGKRIGFLGGAESVDKYSRLRNGWHWSALESVTDADADRMIANGKAVDMLVTHTPPSSVTHAMVGPIHKHRWGLPHDWTDESAARVQRVWDALDRPPIYSGHLHCSGVVDNARVLDINEIHTIR